MMKVLSRAGSTRKVRVSSWDLIFLWGIMIMGGSPVDVCSETMLIEATVVDDQVFRRAYPVFRMGLNTADDSMWLI